MRIREATTADDDVVARMRVRFLADRRGDEELPDALLRATQAWVAECRAAGELRRLTLHATPAGRPMYEQLGFAGDGTWMQLDL